MALRNSRYRHYQHYRCNGLIREGLQWLQAGWRKIMYKRPDTRRLRQFIDKKFYLLPLQVRGDSQIGTHSTYQGMEQVIARSIAAFASSAPKDSHFVIKHHPMDRGYTNYRQLITRLAERFGVAKRVWYSLQLAAAADCLSRRRHRQWHRRAQCLTSPQTSAGPWRSDVRHAGPQFSRHLAEFTGRPISAPDRRLIRRFGRIPALLDPDECVLGDEGRELALLDRLPEIPHPCRNAQAAGYRSSRSASDLGYRSGPHRHHDHQRG